MPEATGMGAGRQAVESGGHRDWDFVSRAEAMGMGNERVKCWWRTKVMAMGTGPGLVSGLESKVMGSRG